MKINRKPGCRGKHFTSIYLVVFDQSFTKMESIKLNRADKSIDEWETYLFVAT